MSRFPRTGLAEGSSAVRAALPRGLAPRRARARAPRAGALWVRAARAGAVPAGHIPIPGSARRSSERSERGPAAAPPLARSPRGHRRTGELPPEFAAPQEVARTSPKWGRGRSVRSPERRVRAKMPKKKPGPIQLNPAPDGSAVNGTSSAE